MATVRQTWDQFQIKSDMGVFRGMKTLQTKFHWAFWRPLDAIGGKVYFGPYVEYDENDESDGDRRARMRKERETMSLDDVIGEVRELEIVAGLNESFGVIDSKTISCRYGDCCIRKHEDGWEYGNNGRRYKSAVDAYLNRYDLS